MNLDDIFGMGRYGGYVWSCVALTVAVLAGNVWLTRRALKAELIRARRRVAANQEAL